MERQNNATTATNPTPDPTAILRELIEMRAVYATVGWPTAHLDAEIARLKGEWRKASLPQPRAFKADEPSRRAPVTIREQRRAHHHSHGWED